MRLKLLLLLIVLLVAPAIARAKYGNYCSSQAWQAWLAAYDDCAANPNSPGPSCMDAGNNAACAFLTDPANGCLASPDIQTYSCNSN